MRLDPSLAPDSCLANPDRGSGPPVGSPAHHAELVNSSCTSGTADVVVRDFAADWRS